MEFGRKYLYRLFYEKELLKSTGDGFQQHFYRLMNSAYSNFIKVEPQGNTGDRKCDGYRSSEGIFYQVYGPKEYNATATTVAYAATKVKEDFEGLLAHTAAGYWEPIKVFSFVFKSHRGHYPDILEAINLLAQKHPSIVFTLLDIDSLLEIFNDLSDTKIELLSSTYIPTPDFDQVSNEIIGELLEHLMATGGTKNIDITMTPPNLDEKITFNCLCDFYGRALKYAIYSLPTLDDFLSSYGDPEISDYICAVFKDLYAESLERYPDDTNLQFKHILDNCRSAEVHRSQLQIFETNTYIIMAKYFETCDIFANPTTKSI